MKALINFLKTKPVFLFALPVFFVLHGFIENFFLISVDKAAVLTLEYLGVAVLLLAVNYLFFRNILKSGLVSFFILLLYLFFGSLHDFLKNSFHESLITRYSFLLPVFLVAFIFLYIILKRKKIIPARLIIYLNLLLLLLILIDIFLLWDKIRTSSEQPSYWQGRQHIIPCDTCQHPNVYLIIADEYARSDVLKEKFQFDNSAFEKELRNRNFNILENSSSNYNFTFLSLESMLNLNYLNFRDTILTQDLILKTLKSFRHTAVNEFFDSLGYTFHNLSIFDVNGQFSPVNDPFIPSNIYLITSQTMSERMDKEIKFNLVKWKIIKADSSEDYSAWKNNEIIMQKAMNDESGNSKQPKFVYIHLMMPHYPYYTDKNGKPYSHPGRQSPYDKPLYSEYLQFSNHKILELIDRIREQSSRYPLILLAGDHGFRYWTEPIERKYYFLNFCAVSIPGGNYSGFHPGMSNVNLFRTILNTQFGQQLPMLKDSVIFLKEK